jgi:hypothetical protein
MSGLEQARQEKLARNELMRRRLLGTAAEDLANQIEKESSVQPERKQSLKDRLADEAMQSGKRRASARAATAAAKRKIADAFAGELEFSLL